MELEKQSLNSAFLILQRACMMMAGLSAFFPNSGLRGQFGPYFLLDWGSYIEFNTSTAFTSTHVVHW